MPTAVGTVAELWRYSVKSLGGELLPEVRVSARGVGGDRRWAVRGADGKLGSGKTTRRFRRMPGLLGLSSVTEPDGSCSVVFPDGERLGVDDPATARRIGEVVGEPVTLAEEGPVHHLDAHPVHLLTTSAMAWVAARQPGRTIERRRFRPNVVVDVVAPGRPEDGWVGRPRAHGRRRAPLLLTDLPVDAPCGRAARRGGGPGQLVRSAVSRNTRMRLAVRDRYAS